MRDRLAPYLRLAALLACQGVQNAGIALERNGKTLREVGVVLFHAVERRIER